MARQPRKKSETGIYHIMMRGINRQTIFEDQDDYTRFLDTLRKYKRSTFMRNPLSTRLSYKKLLIRYK